ncbi:MAG: hypothetical protein ACREV0_08225 [Burkholderiales bacterium]
MDFEAPIKLEIPVTTESESDSLSDRLTQYAEYVDVTRFFPEDD